MKAKLWIGVVLIWVLTSSCLALGQPVSLPEGTAVRVRLKADLGSDQATVGNRVDFEVARPVVIQGTTVIPEGAVAWGTVQSVKKGKFIRRRSIGTSAGRRGTGTIDRRAGLNYDEFSAGD